MMAGEGEAFDRTALRQLFDSCDQTGSGYISKEDLIDGCRRLSLDDLTPEDVDVLFSKLAVEEDRRGHGDERRVSFDAFAERFTEWASAQQRAATDQPQEEQGRRELSQHQQLQEDYPRSPGALFVDDGESFMASTGPAVSITGPSGCVPLDSNPLSTFTASDLAELARKYDADTSGVSLSAALVQKWQLTEGQGRDVVECLSQDMHEDKVSQVIAGVLADMVGDEQFSEPILPVLVVEPLQGPDRMLLTRSSSARRNTTTSSSRRSGSFRASPRMERRRTVARKASLGDADIGDLKHQFQVRQLWEEMKANQPELLDDFASFLDGVSHQLQEAEEQKESLKNERDREARDLDRRARQLDQEASEQIEIAKAKVTREERTRLKHVREELARQVDERDKKLEQAMTNLTMLQTQVQQLEGKGKSMASQYGEMESMKATLEEALEAQRDKQKELQIQLEEASAVESPSRPVSRATDSASSEHDALSKHVATLKSASSDIQDEIANRPMSTSPAIPRRTGTSRAKYTSDEDAVGSQRRRGSDQPTFYSPRVRRTDSFRRSSVKRRPGDSSRAQRPPRTGDSGDDEGSPTRDVQDLPPKRYQAHSTDSDSDMHVDDGQACSPSAAYPTRTQRSNSGNVRSDGELALPRRQSLSPDDLVPGHGGFQQGGVGYHGYNTDTAAFPRSPGRSPRQSQLKWRDSKVEMVVTPPATDETDARDIAPAASTVPPPDVFSTEEDVPPAVEKMLSELSPTSQRAHASIPTASVQPLREMPGSDGPSFSRSRSVRNRDTARHPGGSFRDSASSKSRRSVGDLSGFLDLSSAKPVSMPAVVHPIKAKPMKHSTMQYPISAELVNEMGVTPERVFKIVFCGDSGVGKTSYIWRICNEDGKFNASSFSSTVGVDFQTKLMTISGHSTVLQLWDTAGQERFRTFTKQYFRKADGVICLYDVCNSQSFMNVREWMAQIQEAAGEQTAVMLLGNKIDMADIPPRPSRQVTYWQGQQLAQQSSAFFAEVSAKSGHNAMEACTELGKVLLAAEKEEMEGLLTLDKSASGKPAKKKGCCD